MSVVVLPCMCFKCPYYSFCVQVYQVWYLVLFISVYTEKICWFHTKRFVFAAGSIVVASWIQSMLLPSFLYVLGTKGKELRYMHSSWDPNAWNIGEASRNSFPMLTVRKSSSPSSNGVSILFYNFSAKVALCSCVSSMIRKISARLSGFSRPVTNIRHTELFYDNLQVSALTFLRLNNLCGWPCYSDPYASMMLASDRTGPLAVHHSFPYIILINSFSLAVLL